MDPSIDRSVWGTSTDDFKQHFRQYLKDLAANDSGYRAELIERLEWCFDRWDHWRQKFYAETAAPLWFPFFEKHEKGSELGSYAVCGNSGQPSVISLKLTLLMGDRDLNLFSIGKTKKVVLKADHPDRLKVVDLVILHELIHQYLHEGANQETRATYAATECAEGKKKRYQGHGPLFAAECNRIADQLHPELGFKTARVRHTKRSHAAVVDVQRVSCGQFGVMNLFFEWDPTADDLNDEQVQENRERFQQALTYFGGAIEVVATEQQEDTDFLAPFAPDCADVCHQQLLAYDQAKSTDLIAAFHLAALQQMQAAGTLDGMLQAIGYSTAPVNIPPANGQNGKSCKVVAISESGPTVPTSGDGELATLRDVYPISDPANSLSRLNADIKAAGGKGALCKQRFGLKDGSTLSRHLKALQSAVSELVAA